MQPSAAYISAGNLASLVGRLIRAAFVASLVTSVGVLLFLSLGAEMYLKSDIRALLVGIAVIPALFFVIAHYCYEYRVQIPTLPASFRAYSVITAGVLLILPALVAGRDSIYERGGQAVGVVLAVLCMGILGYVVAKLIRPHADDASAVVADKLLGHMKLIMWDAWNPEGSPTGDAALVVVPDRIHSLRKSMYRQRVALKAFQASHTAHILESRAAASLVLTQLKVGSAGRMLDIGGGEGRFTANLLRALADGGYRFSEVHSVDPIDWEAEYRRNLDGTGASVTVTAEPFEAYRSTLRYELVLASHSLYSLVDPLLNASERVEREILRRIESATAEGGRILIAMASRNSLAYRFKEQALALIFGAAIRDAVAEDIRDAMADRVLDERVVDNVVDLTRPLTEWENGHETELVEWLSYFLRVEVKELTRTGRRLVIELLRAHCSRLEELAASYENECIPLGLGLTRRSIVMPHKSLLFIAK